MTADELLKLINGLPFVTDGFNSKILLTLVASLRARIDGYRLQLKEYLNPHNAMQVYSQSLNASLPKCIILDASKTTEVDKAISRITTNHRKWKTLFNIPIEWRELTTTQISLTNPLIPQYVYFGSLAFKDNFILEETIVHEMSHIWNGFIAELIDFQSTNAPNNLTLPSGTQGKSVRGVLLAALFAAAALNFYNNEEDKKNSRRNTRVTYLKNYLAGCIKLIRECDGVSHLGLLINERLAFFLQEFLLVQGEVYA